MVGFPQQQQHQKGGGAMSQKKTCPYCHQQLSWHALSRHIRDMHRNKAGFVNCKVCNKVFRNKNSLGCHMWRFHRDDKPAKEDDGPKEEAGMAAAAASVAAAANA